MTDYVAIPGPLGAMLVAADEGALLGIWFEGQKYHPDPTGWTHRPENPLLARAARRSDGMTMCRLASNSHPLSLA